MLTVQLT